MRKVIGAWRDVARGGDSPEAATEALFILLVIVARRERALYEYLGRRFTGVRGVQIILDRRQGERRRQRQPRAPDRRTGRERRQPRRERRYLGYTFVTLESPGD